jgi:pimeloyl-ACP methyl ester carboxylesterase
MLRPRSGKLLRLLALLVLAIVVANWTYGRLPSEPKPTGSFVQIGKLRIRYLERQGTGAPVVLIHGLPGTADDFDKVTPLLAGRRTIAIDRPGFGFSTGGYVSFDRQLQTIDALLHKLHAVGAVLVGHSYGGTVSLGMAERYPQDISGLVLVDAAAGGTHLDVFKRDQARLVQVLQLPVVRQIADVTFSQLVLKVSALMGDSEAFDPQGVDPSHRRRVLGLNMTHGDLEALAGEQLAANGVIREIDRNIGQIRLPAVVIQGEGDKLVKPQYGRRLAATLPGARLELLKGGHMQPYTHPFAIAAAVESLK